MARKAVLDATAAMETDALLDQRMKFLISEALDVFSEGTGLRCPVQGKAGAKQKRESSHGFRSLPRRELLLSKSCAPGCLG